MTSNIRRPAVAGMFYPSDPVELKETIKKLLDNNRPSKKYKNIIGIISPHAGYIYSGESAAFAYNVLNENSNFKTAIIISPGHHEYFRGCSIFTGDAYDTPLGKIAVNKKLSEQIINNSKDVRFSDMGHEKEHALEVQLPFLQVIKKDFTIVPIVMGDQNAVYVQDLSKALASVINDDVVIIASSDLSHFHSKKEAQKLDKIIIDRINNFEYPELYNDLASRKTEACGGGGIVALLETADIVGKNKAEVLSYTDSSNVTLDTTNVVGYLSAVVYGG